MLSAAEFLGISAERFWDMTPRHFHAIWKHYMEAEEREDRRAVMLAVTYANCSGAKKRDGTAFSADDFLSHPNGHADAFGNVQTTEQKIAILQGFTETYKAQYVGRVQRGERIG